MLDFVCCEKLHLILSVALANFMLMLSLFSLSLFSSRLNSTFFVFNCRFLEGQIASETALSA